MNVYAVIFCVCGQVTRLTFSCLRFNALPRGLGVPGQACANIRLLVAVVALEVVSVLNRKPDASQASLAARDLSIPALCGPHLLSGQWDGLLPKDGVSNYCSQRFS